LIGYALALSDCSYRACTARAIRLVVAYYSSHLMINPLAQQAFGSSPEEALLARLATTLP